jgi:hypothetical protein
MTMIPTCDPLEVTLGGDTPPIVYADMPHSETATYADGVVTMNRSLNRRSPKWRRTVARVLAGSAHLAPVDLEVDVAPFPMSGANEAGIVALDDDLPSWGRGVQDERGNKRRVCGGVFVGLFPGESRPYISLMSDLRDGDTFDAEQAEELGVALLRAAATARALQAI